jgi:hypothetical protein
MTHRPLLLALLLGWSTLSGCYACDRADITRYAAEQGFAVSTEPPPAHSESLGLVHAEETGFYFVGLFPIVRSTLQSCVDRLLREAREIGAEGLADVRYEVNPAQLLKFTVFPLPDWTSRVYVTGTAWRRRPGLPGELLEPDQPEDPTVRTAPAPGTGKGR